MNTSFEIISTINSKDNKYHLCKITDFENFFRHLKIWKGNRTIDPERIDEIINSIENLSIVPSLLYISKIENKFKIWDGQHRFSAIKKLFKKNKNNINLIKNNFSYFYLFYDDKNSIKYKFNNINKAVPVSDLYTDDKLDELKRLKIIELSNFIIQKFIEKFPNNTSTSKIPKRPNFNRDNLQQNLKNYLENKNLNNLDKLNFWNKILELNDKYKNGIHINIDGLPSGIRNKCQKTNLFLFASTRDFLLDLQL